jgi:hypothetical protein
MGLLGEAKGAGAANQLNAASDENNPDTHNQNLLNETKDQ